MSRDKEPRFFCTDFPKEQKYFNEEEYLESCFLNSKKFKIVGESSPIYLFSKEAIPNILKFNPQAKFVVMVRQPIDLFLSTYYQFKLSQREVISTPEEAWHLQKIRGEGKQIPPNSRNPKALQYGDFCSLGKQIERLFKIVPRNKVMIIFFDDLKNDAKREYKKVLKFLKLPDDGREIFPALNKRKQRKSNVLHLIVKRLGDIKKKTGFKKRFGILEKIKKHNLRYIKEDSISEEFKKELSNFFKEDVQKLSKITGRDLRHWLK
jgi:hypothetical protein